MLDPYEEAASQCFFVSSAFAFVHLSFRTYPLRHTSTLVALTH
jgi:hypothetical protein